MALNKCYAKVYVRITESSGTSIRFAAAGTDGTNTGMYTYPPDSKDPVTWGDINVMWAPCPSDLPSSAQPNNPGDPPKVGDHGFLYLYEGFLRAQRPHIIHDTPKWPRCNPVTPPWNKVKVHSCSLILKGEVLQGGRRKSVKSVDLLNPLHAVSNQCIRIGDGPIEVLLTEPGCTEIGATYIRPRPQTSAPTTEESWRRVSTAARILREEVWSVASAYASRLRAKKREFFG